MVLITFTEAKKTITSEETTIGELKRKTSESFVSFEQISSNFKEFVSLKEFVYIFLSNFFFLQFIREFQYLVFICCQTGKL